MIHERIVNCLYESDLDELDRMYATEDLIRCRDCKYGLPYNVAGEPPMVKCALEGDNRIFHVRDADWYCASAELDEKDGATVNSPACEGIHQALSE